MNTDILSQLLKIVTILKRLYTVKSKTKNTLIEK